MVYDHVRFVAVRKWFFNSVIFFIKRISIARISVYMILMITINSFIDCNINMATV